MELIVISVIMNNNLPKDELLMVNFYNHHLDV